MNKELLVDDQLVNLQVSCMSKPDLGYGWSRAPYGTVGVLLPRSRLLRVGVRYHRPEIV